MNFLVHKQIAIFGLARSGSALINFLQNHFNDIKIFLFDDNTKQVENFRNQKLIYDNENIDWSKIDYLVISPGIDPKKDLPILNKAKIHQVKIVVDIELFYLFNRLYFHKNSKFIGVTGTNGKSTTTALLGHILNKSLTKQKIAIGGNIGIAIFELPIDADIYVLEISSYQLDLLHKTHFNISILLNITPDHLERYDFKMESYIASKKRIIDLSDKIVIGVDNQNTRDILLKEQNKEKFLTISCNNSDADYFIKDAKIIFGDKSYIVDTQLIGKHNLENILACFAVSKYFELSDDIILMNIKSFEPLPHRFEKVLQHKNTIFINDSKSTTSDSTISALKAVNLGCQIYLIIGGVAKSDGIDSLIDFLKKDDAIKLAKIFLIGQAQEKFSEDLLKSSIQYVKCENLHNVFNLLSKELNYNESNVILLSPACASFDQFKNFEERGEEFTKLCKKFFELI